MSAPPGGSSRPWTDGFGRTARSLRISVTDRCNLRCVYCMPAKPEWLPKDQILSYEELARLARIAARCGIEKVHVTGGEPLVRRDLPSFIRLLRGISELREIVLTTNGFHLAAYARALKEAALSRVTVSLDTLDAGRFERMARRPGLARTLEGVAAAQAEGFRVKINMVVIRGFNDDEVPAMAGWTRDRGLELRLIEFMPLEGDRIWDRRRVVPAEEILDRLRARFPLIARPARLGETAAVYEYADGGGRVGVIASVTRPFCGSCDRVRITSDGGFRNCLFALKALDLREPLRSGAADEELAELMRGDVSRKWAGHLINLPEFQRPDRAMNAIGG